APPARTRSCARYCRAGRGRSEPSGLSSCAPLLGRVLPVHEHFQRNPLSSYVLRKTVRQKRTWITGCNHSPFYEYTPSLPCEMVACQIVVGACTQCSLSALRFFLCVGVEKCYFLRCFVLSQRSVTEAHVM